MHVVMTAGLSLNLTAIPGLKSPSGKMEENLEYVGMGKNIWSQTNMSSMFAKLYIFVILFISFYH